MKKALLLFLLTGTLHASESFLLNIPLRFDAQRETGKVLITLTLDSAPAGAQLVVNGATTLNLGQTQTVAGDSVTFEAGVGNEVKITYVPLSNFGANFCAGGGATEKNIPLRFAGAQDVTEYRVSTYIVAAPQAECSQASKRTGDTPANIQLTGDGVAPVLVATNRGRHPYDIVLVLDKSGSMADLPPDAGGGATKVQILKSAMETFVAQWEQLDAPTQDGGEWSHDRIGVVMFDATQHPQTLAGADPPANFFLQRGTPQTPAPWDTVSANIDTLTPGSSTSIGAGINEAMKQWKADPQHDLELFVVTDGMQNTAPLIQPTNSNFLGLDPVSGFPQELRERFVPIFTVGFGTPADVDALLLKNIGLETAGVSFTSVNATTMFDSLGLMLVALLKGNTASIGLQSNGTIAGKTPGPLVPVVVDASAKRVVFSVQWAPPLANALDLEVFRPGSTTPAQPTSSKATPQSVLQTFDMGTNDVGLWHVRVRRNTRGTTPAMPVKVPYTLSAFFLERHLDYNIRFDPIHAATGDDIRMRAFVSYDGKPLAKLPAGAIRVRVQRPSEALGTILHETKISVPPPSPSADPQSAAHAKLAKLTDAKFLERILPKDAATITLKEEGHGIYSATFSQTSTPGLYAFNTVLDWDDRRTGKLHREERLEEELQAKADPAKTLVVVNRLDHNTVRVTVTPRDKFGNYLGPGYASRIKVVDIKSEPPLDRDQTGTYEFTLRDVPPRTEINVNVDGVVIGERK